MESGKSHRRASDEEQLAWSWSYSTTAESEPVVKQEPEWGECCASEAAAAEGLYADHVVKDELVVGPELIQQQDIACSMPRVLTIKEENIHKPKSADGAGGAPKCTHTCPKAIPCCRRSTKQRHELRNCFVRLERLLVADLHICNTCNIIFVCKLSLSNHNLVHDSYLDRQCFTCITCKQLCTYPSHSTLENVDSEGTPVSCCSCVEKLKGNLTSHQQIDKRLKSFSSLSCNQRHRQKPHLTNCKQIQIGEKQYTCNICNKQLTDKLAMAIHIQTHSGEKGYNCNVCNKQFKTKQTLTVHIRKHTGEKWYSTDVGNKQFRRKLGSTRHIQLHTGEKPYSCDICNKRFNYKSTATRHLRMHTGEKPYSCDICNKQFKRKDKLTSHIQIHTGDKPYRCDICSKRFTTKLILTRHIKTHTDEKPYSCDICNKRFYYKSATTCLHRSGEGV